ncbi:MAG: response regulator transcription factor [Saprospiraceae bacterium]
MQPKILLVEDDETLGFLLKEFLATRGFEVDWAENGAAGLRLFNEKPFDLCLLDVMMPALDGFTVAELIRQRRANLPIIFLTAKSLHADVVRGFKAGADDYLKKPVDEEELVARIQAVLKRAADNQAGPGPANPSVYQIGQYIFDSRQGLLLFNGEQRELTEMESHLLKLLCDRRGQLVQREFVLQKIWQRNDFLARKSMDVFIARLRKYLSKDPNVQIVNVHSSGFVLQVEGP